MRRDLFCVVKQMFIEYVTFFLETERRVMQSLHHHEHLVSWVKSIEKQGDCQIEPKAELHVIVRCSPDYLLHLIFVGKED